MHPPRPTLNLLLLPAVLLEDLDRVFVAVGLDEAGVVVLDRSGLFENMLEVGGRDGGEAAFHPRSPFRERLAKHNGKIYVAGAGSYVASRSAGERTAGVTGEAAVQRTVCSASQRSIAKAHERTIAAKTHTSRCDDENAICSASNRPLPPNDFLPYTPLSTISLTSNAT